MILKVVTSKKAENGEYFLDTDTYIDGITNASVYFNESEGLPNVKCTLENGALITISVPDVAYLMNNNGKTIERIAPVKDEMRNSGKYPDLHEAIDAAVDSSVK